MGALHSALLGTVPHAFSTRAERADLAGVLPEPLVMLRQIHSADVVTVHTPWPDSEVPEADALVTAMPGHTLAIVTADCAPVLLADIGAGVVGAAHAGWRGAVGGVLENTVAAMAALGARRSAIVAAIGPTIAQANYEVDAPFRDQFAPSDSRFFAPSRAPDKRHHWHFDLPGFVLDRLKAAGVEKAEDLARDTYADPNLFHSYRRSTHRNEPTKGRQISGIALPR